MKSFWKVYVAVALVGSVVVWFASPAARSLMSRMLKKDQATALAGDVSGQPSGGAPLSAETDHAPRTKASAPAKVDASAMEQRDDPPALLGIFRAVGREKPEWGVTRVKTNFYNEEGKRLGEVPAALIIDFLEFRKSSKGTMARCKFQYKGKEHGPYLVKRSDVTLFTGNYDDLSENQRVNLESYYEIRGLSEERKIEIMRQMARKNPHYVEYKRAYDQYMALIKESRELIVQRDKATGLQRSSLDDRLRRMKNREAELERSYKKIHKQYKAWKTENNSSLPDLETDTRIKEFHRQMRRLAKLLPGLVD